MKQAQNGIRIRTLPTRSDMLMHALMAAALFAVGAWTLASMLQMQASALWVCVGGVAAAVLAGVDDKSARMASCCMLGVALLLIVLNLSRIMDGAGLAVKQLFDVSAANNRYQYIAINVPQDANAVRQAWHIFGLAAALLGSMVCSACARRRLLALLIAGAMAAVQVYFGVVPAWGWNVAWFLVCALALCRLRGRSAITMTAVVLIVTLLVAVLMPGVDQTLEDASERLRDQLGAMMQEPVVATGASSDAVNQTRLENRLNEQETGAQDDREAQVQGYEKVVREQEEISAPHMLSIRRILLWFAVLLMVLVVPFVPFYLWDRRKKQAVAQRKLFSSEDTALAVQAMFRSIDQCAHMALPLDENTAMQDLPQLLTGCWPQQIIDDMAMLMPIWYKAVYSDHPISEEERDRVAVLVSDVEAYLRKTADLHTRLKMMGAGLLPGEEEA